jgi:hypothetical protein
MPMVPPGMTDVILVVTIVAFFVAAGQLVRLCARITAAGEDPALPAPSADPFVPASSPTQPDTASEAEIR